MLFKKKIALINIFFSLLELITFFGGIQFYSGGICNYWRCQTVYVSLWIGLVLIHFVVNIMLLTSSYLSEDG